MRKKVSYSLLFVLILSVFPIANINASEAKQIQAEIEANTKQQVVSEHESQELEQLNQETANFNGFALLKPQQEITVNDLANLLNENEKNIDPSIVEVINSQDERGNIIPVSVGEKTYIVVKEGTEVSTSENGALLVPIFGSFSSEPTVDEIFEQANIMGVDFKNKKINQQNENFEININNNKISVYDLSTQILVERDLLVENGNNNDNDDNPAQYSAKIALPNSQEEINQLASNNNNGAAVQKAQENLEATKASATKKDIASFEQLKSEIDNVQPGQNIWLNITQPITLPGEKSQALKIQQADKNVTITLTASGAGKLILGQTSYQSDDREGAYIQIFTNSYGTGGWDSTNSSAANVTFNIDDITIEGPLSGKTITDGSAVDSKEYTRKSFITIHGTGNNLNAYDVDFSGINYQGSHADFGGSFASVRYGSSLNVYGGKYHNSLNQLASFVLVDNGRMRFFNGVVEDNYSEKGHVFSQWLNQKNYAYFYGGLWKNNVLQGNTGNGGNGFGSSTIEYGWSTSANDIAMEVYGNFQLENNVVKDVQTGNTRPSGVAVIEYSTTPAGNFNKANGTLFTNFTRDTNVSVGQHVYNNNMDSAFENQASKYTKYFGIPAIPLGKITYSNDAYGLELQKKYHNNGVAEGISADWDKAYSDKGYISKEGGYGIIELENQQEPGTTYFALVRSFTKLTVKTTLADGTDLQSGYQQDIQNSADNLLGIPVIPGYKPVNIEITKNQPRSNIKGTLKPSSVTNTFYFNPQNTPQSNKDIFEAELNIVYEKSKEGQYQIYANSFTLNSVEEAKNLTEEEAINKAQAYAFKYLPGDLTENKDVKVDVSSINTIQNGGIYKLKFYVAENPEIFEEVNVTVLDGDTVVGTNYSIRAHNFVTDIDGAQAMSEKQAIKLAGAVAWKNDDNTPATVKVDQNSLDALKAITTKGEYDLTFYVNEEKETERTVRVTVKDQVTIGTNYSIGANNFVTDIATAQAMTEEQAIKLAGAVAWKNDDNTPATAKADQKSLNALKAITTKGEYDLTFYVNEEQATKVTIKVSVKDQVTIGTNYSIAANNFVTDIATAQAMTEEQAIKLAGAVAWKNDVKTRNNGSPTIKVEQNQLNQLNAVTQGGEYDLTFYVDEEPETKAPIKVTVMKDAEKPTIEGANNKEIVVGSNIDLKDGVTAHDYEGNDITSNIQIKVTSPKGDVSDDINTMLTGIHKVEYSVTDKNGLTSSVTVEITVNPIVLPGEDGKPGTDDDLIVTPNPDGEKPTQGSNTGISTGINLIVLFLIASLSTVLLRKVQK